MSAMRRLSVGAARFPTVPRPIGTQAPDAPRQRGAAEFVSADGRFAAGFWEADPGELRLADYPVDELCVLQEGALAVVSADGAEAHYEAGEIFVIPRGFTGTWRLLTPTRKLFACAGETRLVAIMTGATTASSLKT